MAGKVRWKSDCGHGITKHDVLVLGTLGRVRFCWFEARVFRLAFWSRLRIRSRAAGGRALGGCGLDWPMLRCVCGGSLGGVDRCLLVTVSAHSLLGTSVFDWRAGCLFPLPMSLLCQNAMINPPCLLCMGQSLPNGETEERFWLCQGKQEIWESC